jgi:hypothetical protein
MGVKREWLVVGGEEGEVHGGKNRCGQVNHHQHKTRVVNLKFN